MSCSMKIINLVSQVAKSLHIKNHQKDALGKHMVNQDDIMDQPCTIIVAKMYT
jgi:hypothetical protein